jgi:5-methyltetrahydropteroyltriglutamate--homocysteine methyltransferase
VQFINRAIEGRPAGMSVSIHLCRGNFRSAWVAEGGYEPVAEALFQDLKVDGYFLEYDDARSGDFSPLRFVPKGKTIVLGLVSTKVGELESKEELKRRIDEAAKFVPLSQLALSPQCGFSSTEHGNEIAREVQARKLRLVIETAREVWGDA